MIKWFKNSKINYLINWIFVIAVIIALVVFPIIALAGIQF